MTVRHYSNGEAEFLLEPMSGSLVRVTHRDQTGYFAINEDWDARAMVGPRRRTG